MPEIIANSWKDPRTTVCGLAILGAVGGLLFHAISVETCIAIIGLFSGALGILGKDAK